MTNPRISVLLPTRARPKLAERFVTTASILATHPNDIEFILYVDDDDLESHSIEFENVHYRTIIGPRLTMGVCNTRCLQESIGEIIVLGNDDVVIRTEGWDEKIRLMHHSIPDQIYLAYPNDLNKGADLSAFPILSRKTCHLLSEPFPKIYKGAFIDTHLMEIFIRLRQLGTNRIKYMPEVVFEHLHFRTGKVEIDQTYKDRDRFADDMIFLSLHKTRKETARFLSDVINKRVADSASYQYIEPMIIKKPSTFLAMLGLSGSLYLGDLDLPTRIRVKNFFYYVARWIASSVKMFK